jgi:hypothetical protein
LTAFCITAPPALFHVDRAVFDAWIADRAGDLDVDVPVAGSHPAAALEALVDEAQMLGPLRGDPRVELALTTADDHRGSGYMVVVRDRRTPGHLGLTNGWTEMSYPATDTSPEDAVLEYLATVCEEANRLLAAAQLTSQPFPMTIANRPYTFELASTLLDARRRGEPVAGHYDIASRNGIAHDALDRAAATLERLAIEDCATWIRHEYIVDGWLNGYLDINADPADPTLTTSLLSQHADLHYRAVY